MNKQERMDKSIYLQERIGEKQIKRRLARPDIAPEEKAALERRGGKLWRARERRRSETHPKADIEVSKMGHRDPNLPDEETPEQERARIGRYKSEVRYRHQEKRTAEHEARRGKSTKNMNNEAQERMYNSIWETYRSIGDVLAEGLMGAPESKKKHTIRGVKARVQRKLTKVLGQNMKQIKRGMAQGNIDAQEDDQTGKDA